jgi:hypothetical protein
MAPDEVIAWLREVEAQLYRSGPDAEGRQAWVAVVRVPASDGGRGKLIISLGDTLEEAAQSAEAQWQRLWEGFGAVH